MPNHLLSTHPYLYGKPLRITANLNLIKYSSKAIDLSETALNVLHQIGNFVIHLSAPMVCFFP